MCSSIKERIHWVDYYKSFSIFLIVLGHSVLNFERLVQFVFLFHVPLFFFISGYLERTTQTETKQSLKKMVYGLVAPYFLWNALCFFFHPDITYKSVVGLCAGFSLWNGASWFLGVLFFIKLLALVVKNKHPIAAFIFFCGLSAMFFINKRMPFYINLSFMYIPFFFVGMYGKKFINGLVDSFQNKTMANIGLFALGFFALLFCFIYMPIPHTHAVANFINGFYLYWLTGFIGVFTMFFLCVSFNRTPNAIVEVISTSTLFIMCSHYEVIQLVTRYISQYYSDFYAITFVIVYFAIQCACAPLVMRFCPVLAGRKKVKS